MRVRNTAEDAVGRDVVAHFKADPTLAIDDVTISDEAGAATTCEISAGVVTCTAPYLVPDERVTVVIEGTLAEDARGSSQAPARPARPRRRTCA